MATLGLRLQHHAAPGTAGRGPSRDDQPTDRDGVAVLLVEQNARQALKLARRAYVLEAGRVAISRTAAALMADPRVQSAYLGQ
jgi:ABC-type branched-subunit amino acid transport system ATPase component